MNDKNNRPIISVNGIAKHFLRRQLEDYSVLKDINLNIFKGEFVSIVGPSGCGKTTFLHLIAGLLTPDFGSIEVYGIPLLGLNLYATYLFQQEALLPWKTVEENVMLGLLLSRSKVNKIEARREAHVWLQRIRLQGFEKCYPWQLSYGMRKRVSLAQSLIVKPDILLMDEPFSALDVHTRQFMENDLLSLVKEDEKTVIFVTHNLEEAIALSDRVIILSASPSATIINQYPIDIPRPRDLTTIQVDQRFEYLYRTIWNDLRNEVFKVYERQ